MNSQDRFWAGCYDKWVDPDESVPKGTYADLLEKTFSDFPDRPALHFLGVTKTFKELDLLSRRFAGFLSDMAVQRGDVVAICLPNIPQYLIAHVGAARMGCVVSGASPLLSPSELAHQLRDSGARVLVIMDAFFEQKFLKIQENTPWLEKVVVTGAGDFLPSYKRFIGKLVGKIPTGKVVRVAGKSVVNFMEIMRRPLPTELPKISLTAEDVCLLQYTGGTTGLPKGAELTHGNMVSNLTYSTKWLKMERGREVVCSAFPLFHLAGMVLAMGAMASGAAQVLIPDPRNTNHICGELKRYRPHGLANVPSLYQMLLANPKFADLDFSGCRMFISGAAPFAVDSIEAFEAVVGKGKVVEVYGMTEASPLICMNPVEGKKKIGSVGVPIQNTMVKVVDLDGGQSEIPLGENGEIIVSGPQIMKGYRNMPDETGHALREFQGGKWLFTGDIGSMDREGYVYLVDRAKDMLIVGGYKVFSREVEEILYGHQAVQFCAIVGVPNPQRPGSELVKLVVQPGESHRQADKEKLKEELLEFCRTRMAPYKVPKTIEFTDNMPLTAVGKVNKKALR